MNQGRLLASAVAISERRIVSVGTLESMQPWLRRVPDEVEGTLQDRVFLPGFIDRHPRYRHGAELCRTDWLNSPARSAMSRLADRDAVIARLKSLMESRNAKGASADNYPLVAWG